jgi:hypothetical protein
LLFIRTPALTMKHSALAIMIVLIISDSAVKAQDSTRFQRYAYVLGSSLVFSFADYVAFNLLKKSYGGTNFAVLATFRIAEGLTQAAITYFLYKECGLSSAISFNFIWWTWGGDFAYYGWGYLLSLFPWESRAQSGLRFSEYNSAGWTPIGLLRPQDSWIAKNALEAQAVAGLSVSISILW